MGLAMFKLILILSGAILNLAFGDTTLKPIVESKSVKNHNWYPNSKSYNAGVATARDSYAEAASDLGYNNMDSYSTNQITGSPNIGAMYSGNDQLGQSVTYHYKLFPSSNGYAQSDYAPTHTKVYKGNIRQDVADYDDADDGDGGLGGLGGLAGLLGLLGLKGFKGFKLWKLFQLAPLLIPILLPIILPVLLLGLAALLIPLGLLLLIPIPVITIPQGRNFFSQSATAAKELILNEDCVERISCEVSRYARGYGFNPSWVQKLAEKNNNKWINRISKSFQSQECGGYTCSPIDKVQRSLKIKQ